MLAKWMLTSVVVLGLSAPMWADEPDEGPGRGVVRISVLNGDVSVRRGDSGDLVAAAINAPLVVQDNVFTGPGSRAELQFDWANMLRVSANAEVRLAELENNRYQVQVAKGTVTWRVLRDQEAYVEISTPSVSVRPVKRGIYRVSVFEDGSSEITVRSGEAEIFTPRGSERLKAGRTMMARGTTADPEFQVVSEIREDEWDRWNELRDRDLERSSSYRYVSRDIYGAEDLDNHGRWVYVADYGYVWSPRVAVGWAPYRYGRWTWIDWYGWSWVSYDPWGWAPYHYGRWFHSGPYGWCWYPGGIRARHYWSPALVAFFGYGGRVGVGFGWGNVGWFPLGPRDPFHRWWGSRWYGGYRNRGYIDNRITVVNNVNIRNVYRNAGVVNAITGVDHDGFSRGRGGAGIRANDVDFSRASLARGPLPVTPGRDSLRLADRDASFRPTEGRGADRFFSSRRPAQVERVSFDEQRSGVERIARRSFGEDSGRGSGAERGTRTAADTGAPDGRGEDSGRGWRRVEDASRGNSAAERQGGERGEWRRFGSARVGNAPDSARTEQGGTRFGEPGVARTEERSGRSGAAASSSDGWVRFGDRSIRGSESSPSSGGSGREGWRRDVSPRSDGGRSESQSLDRTEMRRQESQSRSESPRYESPRMEQRSEPSRGSGRSESIRISPQIVRERGGDGPRFETGGSRGGGSMRSDGDGGGSRGGGGSMRSGGDSGGSRGGGGGGSMRSSGGGGSRGGDSGGSRSGGGGSSRGGGGRGR